MSEHGDLNLNPEREHNKVRVEAGVDENHVNVFGSEDTLWHFTKNFAKIIRGENLLEDSDKIDLLEGRSIRIGSVYSISYDKGADENRIIIQLVNLPGNKEYIAQLQKATEEASKQQ